MKTKIGIGVLMVFIIGVIFIIVNSPQNKNINYKKSYPDTTKTSTNKNTALTTTVNTKTYSINDVTIHNSKQSCWTVVNNNVYNVTSWISQHPGGANAILYMCGKDATATFDGQHGGQRRPEAELQSFLIGKLNII